MYQGVITGSYNRYTQTHAAHLGLVSEKINSSLVRDEPKWGNTRPFDKNTLGILHGTPKDLSAHDWILQSH